MIDPRRVLAVVRKEWLELRQSWAPWLPGLLMLPLLGLPFVFVFLVPAWTHEPLESGEFSDLLVRVQRLWPAIAALPPKAAIQAIFFEQFLTILVLVPVTGAMSLAAHSIIGEKQARTLEPLMVTPLSTMELLMAKVLASWLPALVLEVAACAVYVGVIAVTAEAGVVVALVSTRSVLLVGVVGPLATLVGVQLVVLSSTRARDPRSAQQVGVLVVLPLIGLLVGQSAAGLWVTVPTLLLAAVALLAAWLVLLWTAATMFDVERVIVNWD